jgi:hypothetical protein
MRKLSLLVALILCVTIGGVYATWSFSASNDIVDMSEEVILSMAAQDVSGVDGAYTIDVSKVKITIDQKAVNDHTAVLVIDPESKIVVTFKPSDNAPNEVKDNAVPSTFTLTTSRVFTYKTDAKGNYAETGTDKEIFTFQNNTAQPIVWEEQADGTFTFTLDAEDIAGMITLNHFELDTLAEYQAFTKAVQGTFVFSVSDGRSSSNPTTN